MGVPYKEIFKRFHQQVDVFLAVLRPDACEIYDNLKSEAPDDKKIFFPQHLCQDMAQVDVTIKIKIKRITFLRSFL